MAELFSPEWMQTYKTAWNADAELVDALANIHFNSVIAYGFPDEATPRGFLNVVEGKVVEAGAYQGQPLNWDLRATSKHWQHWVEHGIDLLGLSMASVTGKLKFKVGDYAAMIKNPLMAGPFVKSFAVMQRCQGSAADAT